MGFFMYALSLSVVCTHQNVLEFLTKSLSESHFLSDYSFSVYFLGMSTDCVSYACCYA